MATQTIDPSLTTATSTLAGTTDRGLGAMKSEDFFKLLVTELKQQDPLQPSKTSDMIGQVSQIRSIELSTQLTGALSALTKQQHTAGASELIGKYVTAKIKDDAGNEQQFSGIVTGVRFNADGTAVVELDNGQTVPADSIIRIQSADAAPRQNGGNGANGTSTNAANTTNTSAATSTPGSTPTGNAAGASATASAATAASGTAAAPNVTTATTDKSGQTAKQKGGGLFPWVDFNASIAL